ncbi:MAG: hypothetical protein M1825_000254 [Sarcosagium campestre]|nr:MAG: hypothetical protein M1825_000254 [Sarcosagium campestre]
MSDRPYNTNSAAEISQLLKDLARGEQTATALEKNLSSLERNIDSLLADFEKEEPNGSQSVSRAESEAQATEGGHDTEAQSASAATAEKNAESTGTSSKG